MTLICFLIRIRTFFFTEDDTHRSTFWRSLDFVWFCDLCTPKNFSPKISKFEISSHKWNFSVWRCETRASEDNRYNVLNLLNERWTKELANRWKYYLMFAIVIFSQSKLTIIAANRFQRQRAIKNKFFLSKTCRQYTFRDVNNVVYSP